MSEQSQGSFINGLAIGMFAGAAGYFLFATKDGSKIRKKVENEWQEAKAVLAQEGVIKDKNITISEMITEWLGVGQIKTVKKKKTTLKTASKKTKSSTKFKGV